MGYKLADVTEDATYREWQRHEVTDQTRGYAQESVAEMLVNYIKLRKARLKHPNSGLAMLDLQAALRSPKKGPAKVANPKIRARAVEFMTRDDEPVLVEDIAEVQKLIAEAHAVDDHLVKWRGHWTSRETLMRVLDDTRGIRAIARAAGNKKRQPFLVHAGPAHRGECSVCGKYLSDVQVYRDPRGPYRWCIEHGPTPTRSCAAKETSA